MTQKNDWFDSLGAVSEELTEQLAQISPYLNPDCPEELDHHRALIIDQVNIMKIYKNVLKKRIELGR